MSKKTSKNNIFLILIIFLIFFFFHHKIFLGNALIPYDSSDQYYPFAYFVSQSYRHFEIPLWNPYIYSGTPSFADPLYLSFYPGTLLFLLPHQLTETYFNIIELIHIFIGGLFTFLLLKEYHLKNVSAMISSVIFILGGPLAGRIQHVAQIYSISLMPLIMFLIRKGVNSGKMIWFACSGLILGSILMIGYQVAILIFIVAIFYFLIECLSTNKNNLKKVLFNLFIMTIIAVGFSAIQILPSLELSKNSNSQIIDYSTATSNSIPLSTFATLIFPNLFNSLNGEYSGPIDITEGYLYIGIIPIFFLFYSILYWRKISIQQKYFIIILALSFFYALGRYTPFYHFIYSILPPIRLFKRPSESLFIFHLMVSINVGFALNLFITKNILSLSDYIYLILFIFLYCFYLLYIYNNNININAPYLYINFIQMLLLLLLYIYTKFLNINFNQNIIFILLIFGISSDLIFTNSNRKFNSMSSNFSTEKFVEVCEKDIEKLKNGLNNFYRFEPVRIGSQLPNSGIILRIPSSVGYSPLVVKTYEEFSSPQESWNKRNFNGIIKNYNSSWFDLLSVKYIISGSSLDEIDPTVDSSKFEEIPSICFRIYQNKNALPLAFIVEKVILPDSSSLQYLADNSLDFNKVALIDDIYEGYLNMYNNNDKREKDEAIKYTIDITDKTNNSIIFTSQSSKNGFLIFNDVYYPGWHVYVDNVETQLLKLNYTFKGTYLPAGSHTIKFKFIPLSFKIGFIISGTTFIIFLLIVFSHIKHYLIKLKEVPHN